MAGRKSDFVLPTLDDLFSSQEERDEQKLSKIRDIPLELIKEIVNKIKNLEEDVPGEQNASGADRTAEGDRTCVEYSNVSLTIDKKPIIRDFSFRFEQGKKYLVIGKNGSGKSSLFKLLKKRFDGYDGSVTVNGRELRQIDNTQLSRAVSYLGENVSLFSTSIRENVLLYRDIDEQDYREAISASQLLLDEERTIIDGGQNVSSGEQRRIEVARTLAESVPVLVFDEVVSTLDIETAYELEKMTLELEDKTVIFISHNFSGKLISLYDEILILDEGSLVAHGKYEDLLQNSEYFRRICGIKFGAQRAAGPTSR